MKRLQFGQVMISPLERRLFAICGGMFRWHPLQVIPSTGTTAMPPRCLRIRSYFATSDLSQCAMAAARSFSSSSIWARTPARSPWIWPPSLDTTASWSASCFSRSVSPLLISSYSPASLRISSSAPWFVFLAMSSSRASAAYSRVVFSSERRDSHLRTFSFSRWRSSSFCRRPRSLSARRPRCASSAAFASSRAPSISFRRAGCRSDCWARSRILRSTFCSSSSALSLSRDTFPRSPVRAAREGADSFATEAPPCQSARARACPGVDRAAHPIPAAAAEWARQDSNLHATGYEPAALAVELRAPGSSYFRRSRTRARPSIPDTRDGSNSRAAREAATLRRREGRVRLCRRRRARLQRGAGGRRRSQWRGPEEIRGRIGAPLPPRLRERIRSLRVRGRRDRLHERGPLRDRGGGGSGIPGPPARSVAEEAVRRGRQLSRDRAYVRGQYQGPARRQHRRPDRHLCEPEHLDQPWSRVRATRRPRIRRNDPLARLHTERLAGPFRRARRDRLLLLVSDLSKL